MLRAVPFKSVCGGVGGLGGTEGFLKGVGAEFLNYFIPLDYI